MEGSMIKTQALDQLTSNSHRLSTGIANLGGSPLRSCTCWRQPTGPEDAIITWW